MELKDIINQMIAQGMNAAQLTDLSVGTVVGISPLEISVSPAMAPLRAPTLLLTQAVIEKKLTSLTHTHTLPEGISGKALEQAVCYEHGAALPVSSGFITLNRGLAPGDKVLMLRAQRGQRYIVLSRLYS